jgi:hypothetical protein
MPNPFTSNDLFRSLKNRFKKKDANDKKPNLPPPADLPDQLRILWPDGTWQKNNDSSYDTHVRGILLDAWSTEDFFLERDWAKDNSDTPDRFAREGTIFTVRLMTSDVPPDWLPSEQIIHHIWGRNPTWDLGIRDYIVKTLREMNKLKP